jgi:hypothetical protein
MMDREDEMIGLAMAAAKLKIPYQDAHRLLLVGRLTGEKRGGRWFVRVADVERLLREREAGAVVKTA